MKMNDEMQMLPYDVKREDLESLEEEYHVSIKIDGDTIIIEGDPAEVDEVCGKIATLPKKPIGHYGRKYEDPYDWLEEGLKISDRKTRKCGTYSTYLLLSFDIDTGKWACERTTYHMTLGEDMKCHMNWIEYKMVHMTPEELNAFKK